MQKKNFNDYDDLYPIKSLTIGDILYIVIMCSILAIIMSMFISKFIFKIGLLDGNFETFTKSLMMGSVIPYALGNFIIYKHYDNQGKDRSDMSKI